jgi:hypothetical protein
MDNWHRWAMTKEAATLSQPWPDGVVEHLPYRARHGGYHRSMVSYWETWQANLFDNEE